MSERRLCTAFLAVVVAFLAASAAAQEKNEVAGLIGRDFISTQPIPGATFFDPNIEFGKGLTVEGSYARRVILHDLYSLAIEVPALFNTDEKLHAGGPGLVPQNYTAIFVTPALRVNLFPATAVSPWASVGGGFGRINENSTLLYGGANTGTNTTSGVFQYGFGLDVRIWRRLHLRGEFRDLWAGEPDFPQALTGKTRMNNRFVGAGVMWRF